MNDTATVTFTPGDVILQWQAGGEDVYDSLWLRDNLPQHRDSRNGQRLVSVLDLPAAPLIESAATQDGRLAIAWQDGQRSEFELEWLHACAYQPGTAAKHERLAWTAQPPPDFFCADYRAWTHDPYTKQEWLAALARDGIAFLRGVPDEDGIVLRIAGEFGFVRETNYGRMFDVRSVAEPNNLAYTSMALPLHTDNPYRDPVPGLQLLHCLRNAGEGGASLLADGLGVSAHLRETQPEIFALLCRTLVRYRFADKDTDLSAERSMIELDAAGDFRAIHLNDRSIAPLALKGEALRSYYGAYRQLAGLLHSSAFAVERRLEPGDVMAFDNTRILHGRTAFSLEHGVRHLQGCYVDRDGLYSTLAVLRRDGKGE